jgi:hypothetical protein
MVISGQHVEGQDRVIETCNNCFENEARFKYLGIETENGSRIHKETNVKLVPVNACRHSSCPLSKSVDRVTGTQAPALCSC